MSPDNVPVEHYLTAIEKHWMEAAHREESTEALLSKYLVEVDQWRALGWGVIL